MFILHTGDKIPLMGFNSKEEAETALLEYQKNIVEKIENLGYSFDALKAYLEKYLHVAEKCHHDYSCTCFDVFYDSHSIPEIDEIDFDEIYIDIKHPLYGENMSVEEAIKIFFLSPIVEEKDVLRINDNIVEVEIKEVITPMLISKKVEELLLLGTIISSITVNGREIEHSLNINYSFTKEEAMTVVKSPYLNFGVCKFINNQHPAVKKAMYDAAKRTFYHAVESAFKLMDAINAVSKIS